MSIRLFTFFTALCLLTASVLAESASAIRSRMEQRLLALDKLKAEEVIGENNRGFVEVRGDAAKAGSLVSEENRDRETVYAIIAKETGSSPDAVGRARAKQISANSRPGVWVQNEAGKWVRK
jgi:uncharacterized protein